MPPFLHHLLHPVKLAWNERIALFWPVWLAITAFAVMLTVRIIPGGKGIVREPIRAGEPHRSSGSFLAIGFLLLFLTCYILGTLVWEDFTYYDDSHFTSETLAGHNNAPQISPEVGRFWPLGYQEFNFVRHFTQSITGYHVLRVVELLLLCGILLVFDKELAVPARVALVLLLLITPSMMISFTGLIYPEANLVFWFACFLWFVQRFERTHSVAWAAGAVVSAQCLLYYKETAFLLVLGFTVGQLVLRTRKVGDEGWDLDRLKDPETRLDICVALLIVPFFLYYLAAMFPKFHTSYAENFRLSLPQVVAAYFAVDLLAWVFVVISLLRGYRILRRQTVPSVFWDALALAGLLYFAGFLILRMATAYYLAPVDLIAVLYLGRLAFLSLESWGPWPRLCAGALLTLLVFQDLSLSTFRMYERKNVIHSKAEMGRAIKERYDRDPQSVKRLFFPFASPFFVLEFASYLKYLGVPIEEWNSPVPGSAVLLVGKSVHKDGPCGYRSFVCHPADTPRPGDLVVVFPDDSKSNAEWNSFRPDGSSQVVSYEPRPEIPRWLEPFADHLHVVSPVFPLVELPEAWLKASVSVWP